MRNLEFATLGSTLVVLGIIFGASDRLIGYLFIGGGVLLSAMSTIKSRRRHSQRNGGV